MESAWQLLPNANTSLMLIKLDVHRKAHPGRLPVVDLQQYL